MGVVSFVSGNNTLRLYYSQQYSKGGQESTFLLERVTMQRDNQFVWPGNYYADGNIVIDGKTVVTYKLSTSNGQFVLSPAGEEHVVSRPGVSFAIAQPLGEKKNVPVKLTGFTNSSFIAWRNEDSFYFPLDEEFAVLEAIPQYSIKASADAGYQISIERQKSPAGGTLGSIASGSDIYIGDVLKIKVTAKPGYAIETMTLNGAAFSGETTLTVSGGAEVMVTVKMQGAAYIGGEMYLPFIDTGTEFRQYIPEADNGSAWDILS